MNKANLHKWIVLFVLTALYVFIKEEKIFSGMILNLIPLLMFAVIITLPLEHKIYCLFFYMQFYLYIYIFSFAFYNVITLSILGNLMINNGKFSLKAIFVSGILLIYELMVIIFYKNTGSITYLIKWILSFFLALNLMYDNNLKIDKVKAIFFLCLGSAIMEIGVILEYSTFAIDGVVREKLGGGLGTLDQNTFAMYCLLVTACTTYLFLDRKIKTNEFFANYKNSLKLFFMFSAVLSLYAGAIMISKTYFLMLVVLSLIIIIFNIHYEQRTIIFLSLLIAAVIALLAIPQTKNLIVSTINRFGNFSNINEVTTGRFEIYEAYVHELATHPVQLLFGAGLFSYNTFFNIDIYSASGASMITHNIILEIICSYGIVGFCLLMITYVDAFSKKFNFKLNNDYNRLIPLIIFILFAQSIAIFREDISQFIILLCFIIFKESSVKVLVTKDEKIFHNDVRTVVI